jgi:hypothetical protein
MIRVLEMGHVGMQVLFDMSAAFGTIDHTILLDALDRRFDIRRTIIQRKSDSPISACKALKSLAPHQTCVSYCVEYRTPRLSLGL